MKTQWECRNHDNGFLIVATTNTGAEFACHFTREEFKTFPYPAWSFWAAIKSLTRSVKYANKLRTTDRRNDYHMRAKINHMLDSGWSISGRDPVRVELGVQVREVRGRALIDCAEIKEVRRA